MGEYIDKSAAVQALRELYGNLEIDYMAPCTVVHAAFEAIADTPAADVVEVVRCKDCRYCVDGIMAGLWCHHPDNRNPLGCRPLDFCSDGEKKEKENETKERT